MPHVWSMQEAEGSWQLEHYRTKSTVWPSSFLTTHPTCEWVAKMPCFAGKMTFHVPHIPCYKYPYTYKMYRASRENFKRETLEKNKIDSSTILDIWFSKFLYSHLLHWHTLERFISQIFISPYPYQWGGILVLGIRKAKEDMVRLNLVGARSLAGLDALGRLGSEGLLLFVYPKFIL